jgi:hypothetical protein
MHLHARFAQGTLKTNRPELAAPNHFSRLFFDLPPASTGLKWLPGA